jgi:signal transduction histidine kinase
MINSGNKVPNTGTLFSALESRILIAAPTGNDSKLTAEFLEEARFHTKACQNIEELAVALREGCGVVVLAEETLAQDRVSDLVQARSEQPPWSDIPIILITSGGEASQIQLRRLTLFGPGGNVTLLERPFRSGTLISVLEVALRARKRQYVARDSVADLQRAHTELQNALRAKDDFLAALSHELRTPLNPVLLVASDYANDPNLPPQIRKDFELISRNVELEARLIDDLLDLTRVSRGKLALSVQPCDVHQVLREALGTVEEEIKKKEVRIRINLNAINAVVMGDGVRLQQVFWNVIKNAVKFTPIGGDVIIETRIEKQNVVVEISDTGIGITAGELARIFEAFSQGEHATSQGSHRFGGLGLGLAISRMLLELHSGTIKASSAGRGHGATFTIELPLMSADQAGDSITPVKQETSAQGGEVGKIVGISSLAPRTDFHVRSFR